MDAFYASVEQRDAPELRGLPLAVGYAGPRGVVMTASYEARKYGIGSAMPAGLALTRCPDLIFVKPRMEVYKTVSQELRAVFKQHTDLVEPLSLDEAYLDVSSPKQGTGSATLRAQQIKREILTATGLTASAGVASNKFLAKTASGQNKPNGLTVITPAQAAAFVAALPIEAFHGVGQVTAAKMHRLGIRTGADLRRLSAADLVRHFGKHGTHFWQIARGQDPRPVEANRAHKSISAETTFAVDLETIAALLRELPPLAEHVAKQLMKNRLSAGGVVVKLKYSSHQLMTRRQTLAGRLVTAADLLEVASRILRERVELALPVRLLGVGVFELAGETDVVQPGLF